MRTPFRALPDGRDARPVLSVTVDDASDAPLLCLLDTGSLLTRLPDWLADEAGIDLAGAPETETNLAGTRFSARFAHVRLASAYGATTCGVWFCSDWPLRFGLLGQQDFLACYRLTLSAHEQWYELAEENG